MTPEAHAALALDALDDLAEKWAAATNISSIAASLAAAPDEKRVHAIESMLRLAFVEGAYAAVLISNGEMPYEHHG